MDLRSATQSDHFTLYALWNDRGVVKWRGSGVPWSREGFDEWFLKRVDSEDHWLCVVEEKGKIAGMVVLDNDIKVISVHIMLFPEFRGQGLGKRVLEQSIPIARKRFNVATLVAVIVPENERSIKLFESVGFEYAAPTMSGEKEVHGYVLKDRTMKICVCGWYFRPDFYGLLKQVNEEYPVTVIAHDRLKPTTDNLRMIQGLEFRTQENIGLEWGAYDYFLKNEWDGESSVLFMHDDVRIWPIVKDYEVIDSINVFNTISKFPYDQVYLFQSLQQAIDNYYIHGRAFFCSARFLKRLLKDNDGFWFDENNTGHTRGPTPKHCKHYNEADYRFAAFIKKSVQDIGSVGEYVVLPALDCARRGKFIEEEIGPRETS